MEMKYLNGGQEHGARGRGGPPVRGRGAPPGSGAPRYLLKDVTDFVFRT